MARYYRKVIRIRAEDSPNVQLALLQRDRGMEPTGEELIPNLLSWDLYQKRRATWNKVRQCIGLDAMFYEGAELLMFPHDLLLRAEARDREVRAEVVASGRERRGRAIGCDPGEGGDDTAWAVGDDKGLIHLESFPTPDTSTIPGYTLALARRYGVPEEMICFDRGGGGKQHADYLRMSGHRRVRTVNFGDGVSPEPRTEDPSFQGRIELREDRSVYTNRRAEMYDAARLLLEGEMGYGIPAEYDELIRQLAAMPRLYDAEGRIYLPPKNARSNSNIETIRDLLGRSPDQADAFVVMVYALLTPPKKAQAGALWSVG